MCAGMLTPVLKPPSRQLGPFWLRSTIYLIKKKDKMQNLLGLILRCSFAYIYSVNFLGFPPLKIKSGRKVQCCIKLID